MSKQWQKPPIDITQSGVRIHGLVQLNLIQYRFFKTSAGM
jgi:hypothetical protein